MNGKGSIDVVIPELLLLPGTFTLSTSIVDESLTHSFDQWVQAIHFDVVQGIPRESGGVIAMHSKWQNLRPLGVMNSATSAPGSGGSAENRLAAAELVAGQQPAETGPESAVMADPLAPEEDLPLSADPVAAPEH